MPDQTTCKTTEIVQFMSFPPTQMNAHQENAISTIVPKRTIGNDSFDSFVSELVIIMSVSDADSAFCGWGPSAPIF